MPMDAKTIETMIIKSIPDSLVKISDLRGDGEYYAAQIVSESFRGKSRIQQHQMVYQALKDSVGSDLHALSIQTIIPE
jgi:stress-induced morphogen